VILLRKLNTVTPIENEASVRKVAPAKSIQNGPISADPFTKTKAVNVRQHAEVIIAERLGVRYGNTAA
jgi:hypothetical protein